jgi:hypothetical protein
MVYRLWVQFEAEARYISMRDVDERAGRWDLRYYFLSGKLQAIESEKRCTLVSNRLQFITTLFTAKEGELRSFFAQRSLREHGQNLARLKKTAKDEGLFPDPKKKEEEEAALRAQLSMLQQTHSSFSSGKSRPKLVIPKIPYKKPNAPVPASVAFMADIQNSLTRAFSGVDDVVFLPDGRLGLVAAPEDPEAAEKAQDRVESSFFVADPKAKGLTMMRSSGRAPLYGVQYIDP